MPITHAGACHTLATTAWVPGQGQGYGQYEDWWSGVGAGSGDAPAAWKAGSGTAATRGRSTFLRGTLRGCLLALHQEGTLMQSTQLALEGTS